MGGLCGKEATNYDEDGSTKFNNPLNSVGAEAPEVDQMAVMRSVCRAVAIMQRVHVDHDQKTFFTSTYDLNGSNPKAVAVSHETEIPADYAGERAADLSPTMEMLDKYHGRDDDRESHAEYTREYISLLASRGLNAATIANSYEDGTVFVCYDYPEGDTSICHRHILKEILTCAGAAVVTECPMVDAAWMVMRQAVRGGVLPTSQAASEKKTFYTSTYEFSGDDPLAVAVSNESEIPASYTGKRADNLAPSSALLEKYYRRKDTASSHASYATDFLAELAKDTTLASIAAEYPDGTIFVCYDYQHGHGDGTPDSDTSLCHRHILAEALNVSGAATVTSVQNMCAMGVMRHAVRAIATMQEMARDAPVTKKKFFTSTYTSKGTDAKAVSVTNASEIPQDYTGARSDPDLSPTPEMLKAYYGRTDDKESHAAYTRDYVDLLNARGLTPQVISESYDEGTIFICYNYPEGDTSICHRQILAEILHCSGFADVREV